MAPAVPRAFLWDARCGPKGLTGPPIRGGCWKRLVGGVGRQADLARDERDGMAVPDGAAKGEGMGKGMAQDSLTGRPGASRFQVETLEAERCSGIKVLERPLCVRSNARRSRGQAESKGAGFLPPLVRVCGGAVAAAAGKTRAGAASRPSGE